MSMLIHESGQYVAATMPLMVVKQDPQGEGSAISYGRRYAACAILGIRTADDDGNAASGRPERPPQRESVPPAPSNDRSPEQELGWADTEACERAHGAVREQIESLMRALSPDRRREVAAELKAHQDNYGWPMVPDALTALSVMVARATPPKAQEAPEQADGSQSAPETETPAPEAPSAPVECFWCEKATGKRTVIVGGQDAEHPARRIHAECEADWRLEQEADAG